MLLSQEQVRFFRHSGYLKLSESVSLSYLNKMREVMESHSKQEIIPFRRNLIGEISRLNNLIERDPIFLKVITSDLILQPLKCLLGPNIEMVLNRHNHATFNRPGDNLIRLHRDVLQWSRTVITIIVYLDNSNTENGCTYLIPGSHFLPFVGTPNNGGTWMDEHSVYSDLINQSVPVPMPEGGILIFDSLLFHTASENNKGLRRSICFAFHSVDELSNSANDHNKLLICGEQLYRGNDVYE